MTCSPHLAFSDSVTARPLPNGEGGRLVSDIGDPATAEQLPRVAERLAGRKVLLTGVTGFVGEALLHLLLNEVPDLRIARVAKAGHFIQNDAPERVNELLIEFLSSRA